MSGLAFCWFPLLGLTHVWGAFGGIAPHLSLGVVLFVYMLVDFGHVFPSFLLPPRQRSVLVVVSGFTSFDGLGVVFVIKLLRYWFLLYKRN